MERFYRRSLEPFLIFLASRLEAFLLRAEYFSLMVAKLFDLEGRQILERVGNTVKRITTQQLHKITRRHF
jgi:hypothetical protein